MKQFKKVLRLFVLLLLTTIALFTTSCVETEKKLDPSTFDDFTKEIFYLLIGEDELTVNYYFENPEDYGLSHYEPSLPTPSVSSELSKLMLNMYFGQIKQYDYKQLNDDQKMTYNLIVDLLEGINAKTSEMSYLSNDYLGSYLGYQAQLPLLLSEYNFRTKLDIDNYMKFLDLVPETFKKYVDFEIEKADKGYAMRNFVIDKVVAQCESFIALANSSEHFMITTINKKIDGCNFLSEEEKIAYKEINEAKVKGPLIEGYTYVMNELPKLKGKSTNEMGLAYYVNAKGEEIGKQYYELDFQDTVGYDISVKDAIKYIDNKLEDYEQELYDFAVAFRSDPTLLAELSNYQLMSSTPEEQLAYYETAFELFFPPLESHPTITVKYIDEAMEDHFSPAAYMTSAIDNYTNEYIYLNGADVILADGSLDYNYLYSTLAHEGYPGHLYQNVYFKSKDVNVIRKVLKSSGYTEGWATYAEMLSYELLRGEYSDTFVDYLIFEAEYVGAIYSRMDMGIHYEGWTLEKTATFLRENLNSGLSDEAIKATYEQLVEVPNNVQTYYFTYFKLKDLKDKVMKMEGENFDYVEFHKHILDCGAAPLKYVEEYVLSQYR